MYCPWPFHQLYIGETGEATTCCPGWTSITLGNVLEESPLALWRGERATKLRESIHDQSFRYCVKCGNPESLIENQAPAAPADLNLIYRLLLSYDPLCNLKCPSCRNAPRRNDIAQRIHDAVVSSGVLKHTMILEVSGGGDPIASPLFWSLLTDKLEHHPGMKVDLKTNGLLVTPERLAAIRAAGRIINCINISVDAACEATYAINRGGDWWRLMSNMEAIRDYPCWRQWNFVVQSNNFREMADFVRLSSVYKVGTLFFSALDNWGSYTDEDYRSRAVHLPGHTEHQEFLDMLSDSVFWDERIIMAKIPLYRQGHVHDHRTSDAPFKPVTK